MEVKDMFNQPKFVKLNKLLESRYGYKFDSGAMTVGRARSMLKLVESRIQSIQHSHKNFVSEKEPAYCQLILMRESLSAWVKERTLVEGEIGEAEAKVAANSITNAVQKMIKDASKIVDEELPALVGVIRDQIGIAEADAYKNSVDPLIKELRTQLETVRDSLEQSVMALSGEQIQTDMSMPGPQMNTPGVAGDEDMGTPAPDSGDNFAASAAETGGTEPLGRARR
jgi:hypothetical protein